MASENRPEGKKGFEWIRSNKSGTSYLCPIGSIKDKSSASDEELKSVCVDESKNPHND